MGHGRYDRTGWLGLLECVFDPVLFALEHRPEQSNEVSALMIMGVSGGALITPCMGGIADMFGQVAGLMLLLICMLYIGLISIKTR